jgi:hypothetical protein
MRQVNRIALVPATRDSFTYLEIEIDGKPLAHHFAGRLGAHPSQLSNLGFSSASRDGRAETVAEFLLETPSELESGRVPVLVCELCGDIGCGAFAVHITREADHIVWSDWAYENGYEPARPLEWPVQPGNLVFDLVEYEDAIRKAL